MAAFFDMGGYAGYIWPTYGIAVVVMAGLLIASLRAAKVREAELKILQQARGHRGRGGAKSTAEEATGADA